MLVPKLCMVKIGGSGREVEIPVRFHLASIHPGRPR
jgi:hypothetical protein